MKFNPEISRELSQRINAKLGECYNNAFRALPMLPGSLYIEGYAILDIGMIVEHGWIEYRGETIDPTWPEGALWYEPGLKYSLGELLNVLANVPEEIEEIELPIFYRFGLGGNRSPEMREANSRALAHIGVEL